ncbi:MAG: pilus assembly protein PilM [Phycisphaerae bacterium]
MASLLESLKKLSPPPRRFAAVDFDGDQLRVVYAERAGSRTRVLKLAAVAVPEGSDITSPQDMGQLLGRTLKDMGLRNVGVLMNVTRAEAVLKPVTLPPGTSRGDLASMVQFQTEKELPFQPEEAVIDFTVERHYDVDAPQGEEKPSAGLDVLVGAVRLPVVDHYRRIAEAAGVKLLRLGLRSYANVRCVDACTRRRSDETLLVVHFGADETEIDVLVGSSLSFSRSAAVKIPPSGSDAHELAESVRSVAVEVVRSVQSYEAVERGIKIDAILVAGGTGVESVAGEELSRRLGAPCELFNPTAALGLGEIENPSAFISALGLAIGHTGADQLPFDFLNPKRPPVERNWPKIAAVSAAAVALLLLAVGVTAGAIHFGGKAAVEGGLRADLEIQQDRKKDLLRLKKRVESIARWQEEGREWLTHWAYLSAVFPSCADSYIDSLKTSSDGSMSFTVRARESKIVTDIGQRLTEAGYKFQPGRLATSQDPFGYIYSTDVRVFVDGDMAIELNSVKPIPRPQDDDSVNQLMAVARRGPYSGGSGGSSRSGNPGGSGPGRSGGSRSGDSAVGYAGGQVVRPPGSSGGPSHSPSGAGSGQPAGPAPVIDAATTQKIRQTLLEKCDRDKNGKLSKSEIQRGYYYVRKYFEKQFDTNGNGRLDSSEYGGITAFLKQME